MGVGGEWGVRKKEVNGVMRRVRDSIRGKIGNEVLFTSLSVRSDSMFPLLEGRSVSLYWALDT